MGRREGREPPRRLLELARRCDGTTAARLVPRDGDVDEALEEVALFRGRCAPRFLELLVRLEVPPGANLLEPALERSLHRFYPSAVATILLCGVDLFMRGKLDALLPGHRLITVDHTEDPELVLADVSRIDPEEVADTYPDIPIVGFTNHTDTSGLRAAHAAGFDQVLAKSALGDQLGTVVAELAGPPEPDGWLCSPHDGYLQ